MPIFRTHGLTHSSQSHPRSTIRVALACAIAIMPGIAAADPISRQSPTVIADTTTASAGHAFFVETNGLDEDTFSAQGWTNPVFGGQHGNGTGVDPSQWSDNAVWIPWTNNGVARMNGFFNYPVGTTLMLGTPWIVPSNNPYIPWQFNWWTMAPPDGMGFVVESGFTWNDGSTGRLNVFGMTLPAESGVPVGRLSANNGIRELWWDGGQWNWSDHGRPPGADTVALGRNSAVWDHTSEQGRVFVVAENDSDGRSLPQLWDLFWDSAQCPLWCWESLGNPFASGNDQVDEMLAPVVVDGVQNGAYFLTVFVVGLHATNISIGSPQVRFELFAKEKISNGAWSDWIQLGNPDNAPFTSIDNAGLFLVDQGARWIDGSLLRGSVFGTDASNQLIHLFHDNNGWQWDAPVPLPQPSGGTIWITSRVSCAALTNVFGYPGWHLTALMRDNTGAIWNREYDSNTSAWTWQSLQ